MCTVSFLPLGENNFILTSNRDEQSVRKTIPPKKYFEEEVSLVYPKDKIAGGTWIGISDKKRLICVLNGAFKKHQRAENYTKSRGVIAKELLKTTQLIDAVEALQLEGVEPFTMILIDWSTELKLYEFVWDNSEKHLSNLPLVPKIWASSTLYSSKVKMWRKEWFNEFLTKKDFSQKAVLNFHHLEKGGKKQAILMKRSYVETVSITSIKKQDSKVYFYYEDVVNGKISELVT